MRYFLRLNRSFVKTLKINYSMYTFCRNLQNMTKLRPKTREILSGDYQNLVQHYDV